MIMIYVDFYFLSLFSAKIIDMVSMIVENFNLSKLEESNCLLENLNHKSRTINHDRS